MSVKEAAKNVAIELPDKLISALQEQRQTLPDTHHVTPVYYEKTEEGRIGPKNPKHEQWARQIINYGVSIEGAFAAQVLEKAIVELGVHGADDMNGVVHLVNELKPQNAMQTMLAEQIVETWQAARKVYHRMYDGTYEQLEMYANMHTKFQRTFVTLLQQYEKMQGRGASQTVKVEHHHHDKRVQVAANTAQVNVGDRLDEDVISRGMKPKIKINPMERQKTKL